MVISRGLPALSLLWFSVRLLAPCYQLILTTYYDSIPLVTIGFDSKYTKSTIVKNKIRPKFKNVTFINAHKWA